MAWSRSEITAVQMAKRSLGWHDPQYHLVLRHAGVREYLGKLSSKNPRNDDGHFVRVMAIAERCGYVDPKKGQGYWNRQAADQCRRLHWKIRELADRGTAAGILGEGALAGYVERMTRERPVEEGGITRELAHCDAVWSYKIVEGLKAWLTREAKARGINLDAVSVVPTPAEPNHEATKGTKDHEEEVPF
jgi:hypothetical protein